MSLQQRGRFSSVIERADRLLGSYNAAPLYYDLGFRVASSWGVSCFNYGYATVSPEVAADTLCVEPFQLELYWQAAEAVGRERFRGSSVLEISCGMGGGLAFLTHSHEIGTSIAL